jgi:hypothetical protein
MMRIAAVESPRRHEVVEPPVDRGVEIVEPVDTDVDPFDLPLASLGLDAIEPEVTGYETPQGEACLTCVEDEGIGGELVGMAIYDRDGTPPCVFCGRELGL